MQCPDFTPGAPHGYMDINLPGITGTFRVDVLGYSYTFTRLVEDGGRGVIGGDGLATCKATQDVFESLVSLRDVKAFVVLNGWNEREYSGLVLAHYFIWRPDCVEPTCDRFMMRLIGGLSIKKKGR